jgi:sirohydrochlorin cobaltochelatase
VVRVGFRRIVVFPCFLFCGVLASRSYHHSDLVAADHPELEFLKAAYLSDQPLVIDSFRERLEEVVLGFETEVGAPKHSHHPHVEGLGKPCQLF